MKGMKKKVFRVVFALLLIVFIGSVGGILFILKQYKDNDKLYAQAAEDYTEPSAGEAAPIVVDFEALKAVNEDVVGWIYCEGTPIDYPVVQCADNDYYLHRSYDGSYSASGAIFTDANNRAGFVDCNTIIYGHHMKNGSMFACLSEWEEQEFYEEHPVIWLLTPEQDYRVDLFSGCTTSAHADIYTIYPESCEESDLYVEKVLAQSDFQPVLQPEGTGRHVLLSTCAYVFDDARYVLFGELVPADSAGGRRIREGEGRSQE